MKAEQLFEKFKVLNEDYNDKLNIAKNKADHSKEALEKEKEKAIETFNKSKKSFEEVFGKGDNSSKEFTNMNNLQKNNEITSIETQLQNAYERVYDELKTLINLANGDILGISNKKQINDEEYKTMVKRLFTYIDKAAVIESKIPAKKNFKPYMIELRKKLQGDKGIYKTGDKEFPNTQIKNKIIYSTQDIDKAKDLKIELKRLKEEQTILLKVLGGQIGSSLEQLNSIRNNPGINSKETIRWANELYGIIEPLKKFRNFNTKDVEEAIDNQYAVIYKAEKKVDTAEATKNSSNIKIANDNLAKERKKLEDLQQSIEPLEKVKRRAERVKNAINNVNKRLKNTNEKDMIIAQTDLFPEIKHSRVSPMAEKIENLKKEKRSLEQRLKLAKNEVVKEMTKKRIDEINKKIKKVDDENDLTYIKDEGEKKVIYRDKFSDTVSIDNIDEVKNNKKSFLKILTELGNLIPSVKRKRRTDTTDIDFEVVDTSKGTKDKERTKKLNEVSVKKFHDYLEKSPSGSEENIEEINKEINKLEEKYKKTSNKEEKKKIKENIEKLIKKANEEYEDDLEASSSKLAKELEDLDSSNIKNRNAQNHAQYQWQKENAKRAQNEALNKAAGFNSVDEVLDKAGVPSVMVKKLLGHSIKFYGNIPSPAGGTFDQLKGYLVLADANKIGGKDSKFVVNIDGKDWYGYKIGKQYRSVKIAETEETRKMHEGEKDVLFIYKATSDEKEKIREVFDNKFKKSSVKTTFKCFNY